MWWFGFREYNVNNALDLGPAAFLKREGGHLLVVRNFPLAVSAGEVGGNLKKFLKFSG